MAKQREDEWLAVTNPFVLLQIVAPPAPAPQPPANGCRLQLFGCACARMVWAALPTDVRNAILVRERYAYGRASESDLRAVGFRQPVHATTAQHYAAAAAAWAVGIVFPQSPDPINLADEAAMYAAKSLASRAAGPASPRGNPVAKEWHSTYNTAFAEARAHQAELVRDIFPPPGFTPYLWSEWLTSTVEAIARQMDTTGDFSAVPILADALQDAGCDDEVMLDRCRAPSGVHCRGNWVVDLVLGRE